MGYLHIQNLYKNQLILLFKECYALEKIHGTSAHLSWDFKKSKISFFSGGADHLNFMNIFDIEFLKQKFIDICKYNVTIYGEAYGGKMQKMRDTYGDKLKFVAFDVKVNEDTWLSVDKADTFVSDFNLDFVFYEKCSTDIDILDKIRDKPSVQSVKCGITEPKLREGIVMRPLIEVKLNNGSRIISKHKSAAFSETKTPRYIDSEKNIILEKANEIANEWVTEMRLSHVLQHFTDISIEKIPDIIAAMIEDVERESDGEIVKSKEARKAISKLTVEMFKRRLIKDLHDNR